MTGQRTNPGELQHSGTPAPRHTCKAWSGGGRTFRKRSLLVKLAICTVLAAVTGWPQTSSWIIDTFAGLLPFGDGGPAVAARLRQPGKVAVDVAGNLYIADSHHQRIRKVDTSGVITTIAGTEAIGFSGDGGPATEAQLAFPSGVAVDVAGNLYIADWGNQRIRKVDSSGTITTFAGSGRYWDGRDYIGGGYGGDGGPATEALLDDPLGVATDGAGNVYIADTGNHRIRKVDTSGVITTIAGRSLPGFSGDGGPASEASLADPFDVTTDNAGNFYIADTGNHRIRKVDTMGIITTMAGDGTGAYGGDGGQAVSAQLNSPRGVAVDGAGNVYIADRGNHRVRKVDTMAIITTMAGDGTGGYGGDSGQAVSAQLSFPSGVTVDGAGNVYIADGGNHRIRKVDSSGVITTIAGREEYDDPNGGGYRGDGGPAIHAHLWSPTDVATDSAENVYIADTSNFRIRKVDTTGIITTVAGDGTSDYGGDGGPAVNAQLDGPNGIAVDGAGNIYIAETNAHRIRKVDTSGNISTIAGTGDDGFDGDGGPAIEAWLFYPTDVATDSAGNVYIADMLNSRVRKVDTSGIITTVAGTAEYVADSGFGGDGGPAVDAQLALPEAVATDSNDNLYIVDSGNHRIRKVDTSGVITTIAGTGIYASVPGGFSGDGGPATEAQLNSPVDVAVDAAGNLYIVDAENHRIRHVNTSGVITTIAGTGESDISEDGGPAIEAQLSAPRGLATDSVGNLYIAESGSHRIRILRPSGQVSPPPLNPGGGGGSRTTVPSAPVNLTAVGGDGHVVLRWNAPENDGGAQITAYEYRIDLSNPWISTGSTNTTHTVTGLVNGVSYVFHVRAVNSIGKSSASNQAEAAPEVTGDQISYFPHLAVGAGWQTTLTYINYSDQEVSCRTEFLSDQGTPLMVSFPSLGPDVRRTDVLPPGGSVHEETDVGLSTVLAAGWARATCSGPVKASLLFRQYDSAGMPVAEAGVNAAAAPAARFVTFAERAPGQLGTGVAYANPSDTAAVVTFTARDETGQMLPGVDQTLMPRGHGAQNMAGLFGLSSFTGSLEITSTEPIVSLSINAEAAPIFSSLPPGEPDASTQGPTTYYFPHLAVGASWQTTITYINDSPEEVTCETEFISDHGSPLMVSFPGRGTVMDRTDVLPPDGSVHEETDLDLDTPLVPGWAKAACTGPVKASLLFRQYDSGGDPVAEAGVNASAVPAMRFVTFAEQEEGKTGTGVAYANPSATAAHVTFTAKDTAGQTLASVVRTLLPNGHDAHVMSALFGFTSFAGSLEVTSTEPIVSLSLNFEAAPVFSSLPPGKWRSPRRKLSVHSA